MTGAGPAGRWSDERLDALRTQTDPLADAAVAEHFARMQGAPAGHVVQALARHGRLPEGERTPAVVAFLDAPVTLPTWYDERQEVAAQEFFAEWGLHVFAALYFGSLPSAYAAARGVQVLHLTARLQTDARRRLNETAQFHLDVLAPGAPVHRSRAVASIRHVRLMHAAVRWLIRHDPDIVRTDDDAPVSGPAGIPGVEDPGLRWSQSWGEPVNQEDLLGTLLTFTEVVFEVFAKTGVPFSDSEAAAYLHGWSVIGEHLGIRSDLLPLDRADATVLLGRIRERHDAPSLAGREMTAALLDMAEASMPHLLRGAPPTVLRHFVGDQVGNILGVPPSDWTHRALEPLAHLTRLAGEPKHDLAPWRHVAERLGRHLLQAMVASNRFGRPAYALPTHLAGRWDVRNG